jgi:hypothetical protein
MPFVCDLVHKNVSKPPFLGAEDFPLQCIAMVVLILLNLSLLIVISLTVDAAWVLGGVKVEHYSFDHVWIIVVKSHLAR